MSSAAARKAWLVRKRATPGGAGGASSKALLRAARAGGAIVAKHASPMGQIRRLWASQSRAERKMARLWPNPLLKTQRAALVNALRVRKGRAALVFKGQLTRNQYAGEHRRLRAVVQTAMRMFPGLKLGK